MTRIAARLVRILLHPTTFLCLGGLTIVLSGRYRPLGAQLWDPVGLVFGALAGLLLYYATAAAIFRRLWSPAAFLRELRLALVVQRSSARRLATLGARSVYEEALWRGTVQVLLGNGVLSILSTAFLFTLRHIYLHRRQPRAASRLLVEFFLFALVLGVLYRLWGGLVPVIAIHFVRNLLISGKCCFQESAPISGRKLSFQESLSRPQEEV